MRTIPDIDDLLQPLENAIHSCTHLLFQHQQDDHYAPLSKENYLHFLSVLEDFDFVTPQQYIMPSGCFLSSERITASLVTLIICQYGNEVVDHDSVRTVKNEVSGSSQAGFPNLSTSCCMFQSSITVGFVTCGQS